MAVGFIVASVFAAVEISANTKTRAQHHIHTAYNKNRVKISRPVTITIPGKGSMGVDEGMPYHHLSQPR